MPSVESPGEPRAAWPLAFICEWNTARARR
jgi:hypothetical protein